MTINILMIIHLHKMVLVFESVYMDFLGYRISLKPTQSLLKYCIYSNTAILQYVCTFNEKHGTSFNLCTLAAVTLSFAGVQPF